MSANGVAPGLSAIRKLTDPPRLSGFLRFLGFQDHLCHGLLPSMRDRQVGTSGSELLKELGCFSAKGHCGPPEHLGQCMGLCCEFLSPIMGFSYSE
jgi:hypothetical protein